jgi:hypothetical protein
MFSWVVLLVLTLTNPESYCLGAVILLSTVWIPIRHVYLHSNFDDVVLEILATGKGKAIVALGESRKVAMKYTLEAFDGLNVYDIGDRTEKIFLKFSSVMVNKLTNVEMFECYAKLLTDSFCVVKRGESVRVCRNLRPAKNDWWDEVPLVIRLRAYISRKGRMKKENEMRVYRVSECRIALIDKILSDVGLTNHELRIFIQDYAVVNDTPVRFGGYHLDRFKDRDRMLEDIRMHCHIGRYVSRVS